MDNSNGNERREMYEESCTRNSWMSYRGNWMVDMSPQGPQMEPQTSLPVYPQFPRVFAYNTGDTSTSVPLGWFHF